MAIIIISIIIIINIIIIIVYSWLPVFEKHLQKANHDGVLHRGDGLHCGSLHMKTARRNKDKKHVLYFFTRMFAPQQKLLQHKKHKNKWRLLYIQDRVRTSVHTCVHNAHKNHTRLLLLFFFLFYCWFYFLEASYLTSWYNDTKQINTYIYSTYREKRGLEHKEQLDLHPLFNRLLVFGVHHTTFTGFICGRERFKLRRFYFVSGFFFLFFFSS